MRTIIFLGVSLACVAAAAGGVGVTQINPVSSWSGFAVTDLDMDGHDIITDADGDSRWEHGTDDIVGLYLNSTQVCEFSGTGFALPGDVTLTAGGSILTTSNGNISLAPHGSGIVEVSASELVVHDGTAPAWGGGKGELAWRMMRAPIGSQHTRGAL